MELRARGTRSLECNTPVVEFLSMHVLWHFILHHLIFCTAIHLVVGYSLRRVWRRLIGDLGNVVYALAQELTLPLFRQLKTFAIVLGYTAVLLGFFGCLYTCSKRTA
jgi:hypothetical protein